MIRAALVAALALAAVPAAAAAAAVPPALGPEGRVFPLVGGGSQAPRDGLPASRLRIGHVLAAAPLADGSVAVIPLNAEPFAVGTDGRIRLLPELPGEPPAIDSLEGAADGALLALPGDGVYRLDPGAAAWARQARPAEIPASFRPSFMVPLPHGYALIGHATTWRVEAGAATRVPHPPDPSAATATADGTIVLGFFDDRRLLALPPNAPPRVFRAASGMSPWARLLSLPGGGIAGLRDDPFRLEILGADGALQATLRTRDGLGSGDGGPFERQLEMPVGRTPDGAFLLPGGPDFQLRLAVPPGTARPLAAIARGTYDGLRRGTVTIASTFAGAAGIEVRSGGEVVTAALAEVGAGTTRVQLRDPPPPGDYRVALRLTAPGGGEARHHLRVVTLRRLSRTEAHRAARRFERRSHVQGPGLDVGRCERAGARRFACQAVQVERRPGPDGRVCAGIWAARLRPDGMRSRVREAPRACRKLGRA